MSRVCVGAMMVNPSSQVQSTLLCKRTADRALWPNLWDLPGGHLELRETSEQALIRELEEEIGVTPTSWLTIDELRGSVNDGRSGDSEFMILVLYKVTAWIGTPRNLQPSEHEQIAWFTVEEACGLQLAHYAYPQVFKHWL